MPTSLNQSSSSTSPSKHWRTVRPWLPPSITTDSSSSASGSGSTSPSTSRLPVMDDDTSIRTSCKLRLEVLDVTSTAVTLSVFTPYSLPSSSDAASRPTDSGSTSTTPPRRSKPPLISIQLDRRPWPHVAHAGSISTEALVPGGKKGAETTVIIWGLDPGRDYEISLGVVGGEDRESESMVVDVETALEEDTSRTSIDLDPSLPDSADFSPAPSPHPVAPEGPPPPYSPTLPPLPPDEAQLRALLKKIRTSSKRTETVLQASISALKKSVEKSIKEDQRARTRIVGLEEAIRKAREGEHDMRTTEKEACEGSILELQQLEQEVKAELEGKKEGKQLATTTVQQDVPVADDAGEEEEGPEAGIGELAKELEMLHKQIEEAEKERRKKAKETLRSLEVELGQLEGELIQMDREEAYRYSMAAAAHRSSDSLGSFDSGMGMGPQLPLQPPHTNSGFNLRWRRQPNQQQQQQQQQHHPQQQQQQQQQQQPDPRSFGRFFRRNAQEPVTAPVSSASSPNASAVDFHAPSDRFQAHAFAQEQQGLWAPPNATLAALAGKSSAGTSARAFANAATRRRSGSLNSPLGTSAENGTQRIASVPIALRKNGKEERPSTSGSGSSGGTTGASWGKLGTWSQVVVRNKAPPKVAAATEEEEE